MRARSAPGAPGRATPAARRTYKYNRGHKPPLSIIYVTFSVLAAPPAVAAQPQHQNAVFCSVWQRASVLAELLAREDKTLRTGDERERKSET